LLILSDSDNFYFAEANAMSESSPPTGSSALPVEDVEMVEGSSLHEEEDTARAKVREYEADEALARTLSEDEVIRRPPSPHMHHFLLENSLLFFAQDEAFAARLQGEAAREEMSRQQLMARAEVSRSTLLFSHHNQLMLWYLGDTLC